MYIVVHTHRGILSELEYRSRRGEGEFFFVTHRDTRQKYKNGYFYFFLDYFFRIVKELDKER